MKWFSNYWTHRLDSTCENPNNVVIADIDTLSYCLEFLHVIVNVLVTSFYLLFNFSNSL